MSRRLRLPLGLFAALTLTACAGPVLAERPSAAGAAPGVSSAQRYEYVFPDGGMYVYDLAQPGRQVSYTPLPGITGIRGVGLDTPERMLFISHGGDGDGNGVGSLLKYDLLHGRPVWDRRYGRGVDSFDISPDGRTIFLPDGELSHDGVWMMVDAASGRIRGRIVGGRGPHNTVVGPSGRFVYLGGRNDENRYLDVATLAGRVIRRVGPLRASVRPFTINGAETLAFTTATGFLGFQVSSLNTGRVLYTTTFGPRFRWNPSTFPGTAPSHGIALTPDERQLWVIDAPNGFVHAFAVDGLPTRPPRPLAQVRLPHDLRGEESSCAYDCLRDGWLGTSLDGCLVLVGDSGDVISTRTLRPVAFLPALRNTRKFIEIDWRGGVPAATSTREGLGRRIPSRPSPASCR